ncbi:MAG: glutathione peroxidase [Bacteroidetes bacterium]|nr:glutathione peroxidase [Bacteroidota bacterium]
MKVIYIICAFVVLVLLLYSFKKTGTKTSIYQFKAKTIDGEELRFESLKGKKILIVNTASKCGFTPQYKDLEALYEKYKDNNFVIIGFPCNQFGNQEPGTSSDIKSFCTKNYGVSFPMMEKVHVKGDSICDIYAWLTSKTKNGVQSSSVKWNFQKYMIDENGFLVGHVSSFKSPSCSKIINWIEGK